MQSFSNFRGHGRFRVSKAHTWELCNGQATIEQLDVEPHMAVTPKPFVKGQQSPTVIFSGSIFGQGGLRFMVVRQV